MKIFIHQPLHACKFGYACIGTLTVYNICYVSSHVVLGCSSLLQHALNAQVLSDYVKTDWRGYRNQLLGRARQCLLSSGSTNPVGTNPKELCVGLIPEFRKPPLLLSSCRLSVHHREKRLFHRLSEGKSRLEVLGLCFANILFRASTRSSKRQSDHKHLFHLVVNTTTQFQSSFAASDHIFFLYLL